MLSSDQKGAIAEAAIVHAAVLLGIGVLKPLTDGVRYDLAFDLGARLLRIQCKWAGRRGEVVAVRCCSTRRGRECFLRRRYTSAEVDGIAAYCPDTERCYFLPADLINGRAELSLRLGRTRNGQALRIRWADDYDFTRIDWESISGP
jgi:PD-(D/E)XK endonuclease